MAEFKQKPENQRAYCCGISRAAPRQMWSMQTTPQTDGVHADHPTTESMMEKGRSRCSGGKWKTGDATTCLDSGRLALV